MMFLLISRGLCYYAFCTLSTRLELILKACSDSGFIIGKGFCGRYNHHHVQKNGALIGVVEMPDDLIPRSAPTLRIFRSSDFSYNYAYRDLNVLEEILNKVKT